MAKGKSFEHLVRLIQELLKDHPATEVFHNQKLTSRGGRKRQFDVLVKTSINGYPLRVAIECKNHSRKVEAEAIEAFHCKCELVGGINKLVFVSNAGFQEGAIVSAIELGVTLHTLKEVTGEQIVGWINTEQIYTLHFFKKFHSLELGFACEEGKLPKLSFKWDDLIFYTDGQQSTLHQFIDWLTREENFQRIVRNILIVLPPLHRCHFKVEVLV